MTRQVLAAASLAACIATISMPVPACADDTTAQAMRTVAQALPVGAPHQPLRAPGLPRGLTYTLDANVTWPLGDVGYNAKLPGGIDAVAAYGFSPSQRLQVGYYEVSEYPVGFSNVTVPFYLQGFTGPGTTVPGTSLGTAATTGFDVTVKNKIVIALDQNLIRLGRLPLVISPGYISRSGTIGGHTDETLIEYQGFPTLARLRTVQYYLLALTVPFLSTPKMFATATIAPQWLVHEAGVNQTNHAQLFELLYLEYRANKRTTFWVQPSRLITYVPADPYPEYIPTTLFGASYRFTPTTFVQVSAGTGAATNRSPYGVVSLTCQRLPCAPAQVAPGLGGLHAAQAEIQFGIGTPAVIPQ